jgi:hypothetical protein
LIVTKEYHMVGDLHRVLQETAKLTLQLFPGKAAGGMHTGGR